MNIPSTDGSTPYDNGKMSWIHQSGVIKGTMKDYINRIADAPLNAAQHTEVLRCSRQQTAQELVELLRATNTQWVQEALAETPLVWSSPAEGHGRSPMQIAELPSSKSSQSLMSDADIYSAALDLRRDFYEKPSAS